MLTHFRPLWLIVSVSRRRQGLGPCAAPFGRSEPQSQLPFLSQRPKAAPGAHGETWAGLCGGRAGLLEGCVWGWALELRPWGPLSGSLAGCKESACPLSRLGCWKCCPLGRRPPPPTPGSWREGGEGLVTRGARGLGRSRLPFPGPLPTVRRRGLTFLRTESRVSPRPQPLVFLLSLCRHLLWFQGDFFFSGDLQDLEVENVEGREMSTFWSAAYIFPDHCFSSLHPTPERGLKSSWSLEWIEKRFESIEITYIPLSFCFMEYFEGFRNPPYLSERLGGFFSLLGSCSWLGVGERVKRICGNYTGIRGMIPWVTLNKTTHFVSCQFGH